MRSASARQLARGVPETLFIGGALNYEELDKELPVRPKPPLVTLLGAPDGRETPEGFVRLVEFGLCPTVLPLGATAVVPPGDIKIPGPVEILGP